MTVKRMFVTAQGLAMFASTLTACSTLGGGSGAAIAAGTGHDAGKGALMGTGVGAAAGAINGAVRK